MIRFDGPGRVEPRIAVVPVPPAERDVAEITGRLSAVLATGVDGVVLDAGRHPLGERRLAMVRDIEAELAELGVASILAVASEGEAARARLLGYPGAIEVGLPTALNVAALPSLRRVDGPG